jgi:hypothetical protein
MQCTATFKPSDIHSDRPFYDMIRSPSIEKLTVAFRLLDWQTKNDFDQDTHMIKTDFPDGSHLYMSEFYSIADQKYIAGEFWAQRWWRWARAIETIAPWALVPCVLLFILGYAFLWIGRGFARA